MSNLWKDPYTWQEAYSDVDADPASPSQSSQFPGGRDNAAILIDYQLTFDVGAVAPAASIVVELYNGTKDTYQEFYTESLEEGNHRLKIDTHGSPGQIRLKDISEVTVDWLLWTMVDRATGGN